MGFVREFAVRLADYNNPGSLGSWLRRRRLGPLLGLLERIHARHGAVNVLDIGGTREYWSIVPEAVWNERRMHVSVLNLPGMARGENDQRFTFLEGDGCDLAHIESKSFHLAHSNSAIEHVGDWPRVTAFASELRRVSVSYYVQTPYFWSPFEPHFMWPCFHWLPVPLRARLLMSMDLGQYDRRTDRSDAIRMVEDVRLLDRWMMQALFPDARLQLERVLLVPKSIVAIGEPRG
jgi:hypothetical protein